VLHFAGHTRADDQNPWRSGITVRSARQRQAALHLTAEQIAIQPMSADLVVLSSCESGGGRALSGEGLAGLSTAFLAAGSRTVVATLWPVDDTVTGLFVEQFYLRLERGDDAGEALRFAQERLRRARATAHPFYWAGFVLAGEAGTHPELQSRAFPLGTWQDYLVGVCALLTVLSAVVGLQTLRQPTPSREGV
jgi:CHAT domain-containing protein